MYARCPNCRSIFEISHDDLAVADGQTCCGVCDTVFDARDTLTDELPEDSAVVEQVTIQTKKPDPTSTRVKHLKRDLTGKDSFSENRGRWLLAVIVLALLATVQWLVANRDQLVAKQSSLIKIPQLLGFESEARWDPSQLLTEKKMQLQFIENREASDAVDELHAMLQIKNVSTEQLPTPHLLLNLNDRWGETILQRMLMPDEYSVVLEAATNETTREKTNIIPAGSVANITVELVDPGRDVLGFSWDLCYPQKGLWHCQRSQS